MDTSTLNNLDAEELFRLAVRDSQTGRHDEAISKLKSCLLLSPADAKAQFLLGAEHAEIGLYDRAIEEISHAIKLDHTLSIAHFQLGLLYFSANRLAEARQSWVGLSSLTDADYLSKFSSGLVALAEERLLDCIESLSEGLALNTVNPALNVDMDRVLGRVKKILAEKPEQQSSAAPASAGNMFLGSYRDQSEERE